MAAKGAFVRASVAERFVAAGARAVRRPGAHRLAFMVRGYMNRGNGVVFSGGMAASGFGNNVVGIGEVKLGGCAVGGKAEVLQ